MSAVYDYTIVVETKASRAFECSRFLYCVKVTFKDAPNSPALETRALRFARAVTLANHDDDETAELVRVVRGTPRSNGEHGHVNKLKVEFK